ncbi:MAG: DUF1800 domain-containing protein [Terrimicrobiaceae bacterium]
MAVDFLGHDWTRDHAAHLLARAGFGGNPAEIDAAHRAGATRVVDQLLDIREDDDLFPALESFSDKEAQIALAMSMRETKDDPTANMMARKQAREAEQKAIFELRAWWLQRMRYSANPTREKMVLFWHGHFACSFQKVRNPRFLWRQNELFRMHAFGSFRDLAGEISMDPAMMRYLDIAGSSNTKPNENFARELMELFLLGEGQYSEEDIREAARAFTGYRVNPLTQEVAYQPRRADTGEKSVFGKTGAYDAKGLVNLIVDQPECAPFLVNKLWAFFAGGKPTPATEKSLAQTYRHSNHQTRAVLRAMFLSPEFYAPAVIRSQIKSPVEWLVGTSKSLETALSGNRAQQNALRDLGQTLFEPPNVKGWEGGRSWISSSTFLARCNLAGTLFLSSSNQPGSANLNDLFPDGIRNDPQTLVEASATRLFLQSPSGPEKDRWLAFLHDKDFPATNETIADLLRVMMSSPNFQLT